jgi:hypothetical protein
MCLLVAIHIRRYFFATSTYFRDNFETGRTVPFVAPQRTLMPTPINFLASIHTSRYRGLTMNGRVGLGFATGAEKRLRAHPSARLAKAEVAEGAALMLAARESLLAGL